MIARGNLLNVVILRQIFFVQAGKFEDVELEAEGEECTSDDEEVYYCL